MTYLVTGASGFLGSYIVQQLVDEGETVVGFDRSWPGVLPRVAPGVLETITAITGDVADFPHLARVVSEHHIDHIIHMAGELHARSADNPGSCISSNVIGTHNVLELGRVFGVERIVTASSAAVFGPPDGQPVIPMPNNARTFAGDVYEAAKIFGEAEGEFYFKRFGVDNVAIRVGLAYGFGCTIGTAKMFLDELIEKPLRGEPGRVPWGDGIINWTYPYDSAAAFIAASRSKTTETFWYNLRGEPRTIREAAQIMNGLLPDADIEALEGSHRWAQELDGSVIEAETGFRPKWSLEDGLADSLARLKAELAA